MSRASRWRCAVTTIMLSAARTTVRTSTEGNGWSWITCRPHGHRRTSLLAALTASATPVVTTATRTSTRADDRATNHRDHG